MRMLVVGKGGREHAMAEALAFSEISSEVWVIPGNAGMRTHPKIQIVESLSSSGQDICNFVQEAKIEFVWIGPEKELADGLSDQLTALGVDVLGPSMEAAQLESSKIFSKKFMAEFSIPTAPFQAFSSAEEAKLSLKNSSQWNSPVIKVDGLAGGKGVVVAENTSHAIRAIENFMEDGNFPIHAEDILIEERLKGKEISVFALCDGNDSLILGHACDYKRLNEGNLGPNTGGMGTFSPAPWFDDQMLSKVKNQILDPTLRGMKEKGVPFKGILFMGLMVDEMGNPFVIEYNVRFGDPETQSLLPLLDEDIVPFLLSAARGNLRESKREKLNRKNQSAVHVVLTAEGYPGTEGKKVVLGDPIDMGDISSSSHCRLFFAGVKGDKDSLLTNGGRVLGVTALGANLEEARLKAYGYIEQIKFRGAYYRRDIGSFGVEE